MPTFFNVPFPAARRGACHRHQDHSMRLLNAHAMLQSDLPTRAAFACNRYITLQQHYLGANRCSHQSWQLELNHPPSALVLPLGIVAAVGSPVSGRRLDLGGACPSPTCCGTQRSKESWSWCVCCSSGRWGCGFVWVGMTLHWRALVVRMVASERARCLKKSKIIEPGVTGSLL